MINNIVKGLAKVFQFFLQFLAGEEDTALHGAQREVQLFSDFAVLEAGNVHIDGRNLHRRKTGLQPCETVTESLLDLRNIVILTDSIGI